MSDNPSPTKPTRPRLSHLHSEPVPISFASPQQLAQFAAGGGSFFGTPRMPAPHQMYRPQMSITNNMNYQIQPMPSIPNNAFAAIGGGGGGGDFITIGGGGFPMGGGFSTGGDGGFITVSGGTAAAGGGGATAAPSSSTEKKPLTPLPPQPIDLSTFKGFKFVTLDPLQVETREIYDEISGTFQWEMFEGQDERCVKTIRDDLKTKRIFLVSSGSLGEIIVPQIHDLPQIYTIYIYCANVKRHREWSQKFSKVRVVCDNDDLYLLPQFAVDVAQANIDWGNAFLQQGTRDKAKEKFKLASDKLNKYARNHDQTMDEVIKSKLEECDK